MKIFIFGIGLFTAALFGAGCASGKKTAATANLCKAFQADLSFVHSQLRQNSSNYNYDHKIADDADHVFTINQSALCTSDLDYIKLLRNYVATYKDPHLKIKILGDLQTYNTGIYIRKFDDKYIVWDLLPEIKNLEKGDELISCDGLSSDQILNQNIIPYESVNSSEMFKATNAYRIFYRWDIEPKTTLLCTFKNRTAGTKIINVLWKKTQNDDLLLNRFYNLSERSLFEFQKYKWGHYIRLSGMYAQNEKQEQLLEDFVDFAKSIKPDSKILLDLRGNGGGDSSYGDRWLKNLIGYSPDLDSKPEMVWASEGNIRHFGDYIEKAIPKASEKEKISFLKYKNCLSSVKDKFVTCDEANVLGPKLKPHTKITGTIYVLTDEKCFSSCEIFLAKLRRLKNVIHLGHNAGQSTLFGDVRTMKSTSENIQVTFPQKVFFYATDEKFRKPQIDLTFDIEKELNGIDSLKEKTIEFIESGKKP